ncbi:hypothetical protein [Rhodohalobacter sp.]|uniref:hypothetical protein n=1 Tax=Rhodohalobacter sp. TaxID=1974210 RepID=UPI003561DAE5
MSLEIVTIIVGTVLVLLALVGSMSFKESSEPLMSAKVRVSFGLVGIMLVIYGGYTYGITNSLAQMEQVTTGNVKQVEYPVDRTQIISPVDGDRVDCRILTMGVYPEPLEKDIWVLLMPSDGFYYPQSDQTNTSYKRDGGWQVITRFGGDLGENYDIIAYEADSTASEFFSSTIQEWKDELFFPGLELEEIPDGAEEVDRITVSLQKNCRGVF